MQRITQFISGTALIILVTFQTAAMAEYSEPRSVKIELATLTGLMMPESTVAHPDGRVFVTEIGEFGVDGDGKVTVLNVDGSSEPLVTGLNDPKGIALFENQLYVADNDRLLRISLDGRLDVLAKAEDFPGTPQFLNDVEIDGLGNVYISDSGDDVGRHGGIYRYSPDGVIEEILTDGSEIKRPNGLLLDGIGQLLVADFGTGKLFRLDITSGNLTGVNQGFGGADGLARDSRGFLYISDWANGKVWQLIEPRATPRLIADHYQSAADISISADGRFLLVPDMKAGTLEFLPIR